MTHKLGIKGMKHSSGGTGMPSIPNFPAALLEEHSRWHHANHYTDRSQLPQGYGESFLKFHRQFIAKALQWYNAQGYNPSLVAPWQSVPEWIRRAQCYDRQAEARVLYGLQSFATADELGLWIEGTNLHGCMHRAAAQVFDDELLPDFDTAPQSTIFYNIHGMIDNWYRQWESLKGYQGRGRMAGRPAPGRAAGRAAGRSVPGRAAGRPAPGRVAGSSAARRLAGRSAFIGGSTRGKGVRGTGVPGWRITKRKVSPSGWSRKNARRK
jgi:hypothetical protein